MTDYPPDQPIFSKPLALVASDETNASTCSTPPKLKSVPAGVRSLISKLGLRYEPSSKADLDAHAARVALLAEDLAEVEPWKLQQAISQWVQCRPFMPKASDLREIMDTMGARRSTEFVDVVSQRNAILQSEGSHLRWAWNNPDDWGAGTHLYSTKPLENKLAALIAEDR